MSIPAAARKRRDELVDLVNEARANYYQHDKPTISRLFQIASVSHSKDDTDILVATVLKPIGESLRIMSDGARFIIVEAIYTHSGNKKEDFYFNMNKDIFEIGPIEVLESVEYEIVSHSLFK
mgnify:CR=1 FL=1